MRLFYALVPDEALRSTLAELARAVQAQCGGRAIVADNIHLTLAFVGSRPEADLRTLSEALDAIDASACTMELAKIGAFRRSGVAWIAPLASPTALPAIVDALFAALAPLGVEREARAYSPHVTLVRDIRAPLERTLADALAWRADRLCLMASETLPGGARYRVLAERILR